MKKDLLFSPVQVGRYQVQNRIVLPPMTRSRAFDGSANELMAEYYAQRASAGLIVAEGTPISALGRGYAWTPGIYTPEQIKGWQLVTDAVHQKKGLIFAQLWHVGRVSHPDNTGGEQPIDSAIRAPNVRVFLAGEGGVGIMTQASEPRAMSQDDIQKVINEFRQAALNAIEAGFDGIELHAANGYLINQFIASETNLRTDEYGGSLANRLRFLDEVVAGVVDAIGADRVGVRLAPLTTLGGAIDAYPEETYTEAVRVLNRHKVAYVHIAEADWDDAPLMRREFKQALRDNFDGALIYAGQYTPERAVTALDAGLADMIGFGRAFIANPDLPRRIKESIPFQAADDSTFFGGTEVGLTDYPEAITAV